MNMPTMPMLKMGSWGDAVKTLQGALNLWQASALAPLSVDGAFGPKTDGKVREFQGKSSLSQDGVVGTMTWDKLKPLLDALIGMIQLPANEQQACDRIIMVAESALSSFGWAGQNVTPNKGSHKIAAAICADPSDPVRPRQGGMSLASIFSIAGAPTVYTMRCLTISSDAFEQWQKVSADATAWRNNNDLPAWCGIFCYYVYRTAGINLGGWISHQDNMWKAKRFRRIPIEQAFRGCIGVEDGVRPGGRNHHFIVTGNQDGKITSIDGNSFGPVNGDFSQGLKSVIAAKSYNHSTLKGNSAYFLFPDFAKL
jgi:hypothetical protein